MFTAAQWITLAASLGSLVVTIIIWGIRLESRVDSTRSDLARCDSERAKDLENLRKEREVALASMRQQHASDITGLQRQWTSDITGMQQLRSADLAAAQAQRMADRELYGERFNRLDTSMNQLHEKMDDLLQLEGNRRRA